MGIAVSSEESFRLPEVSHGLAQPASAYTFPVVFRMVRMHMNSCTLKVLSLALFVLGLFGEGFYCFERPTATPDTLIYVSMLEQSTQADFQNAVRDCTTQVPGPHGACESAGSGFAREIMSYSPAEYATFLRFYEVKPLYTWTALLVHRELHLPAFISLRLISSISFIVVGFTILLWLLQSLSIPAACLCSLLIMALPPVIALGKFLLPDAFSTALMLPVIYIVLYRARELGVQLFLLAILPLARPDNILFAGLWGMTLIFRATPDRHQRVLRLAGAAVGYLLLNTILQRFTHALPYAVLFNHSFLSFAPPSTYPQTHLAVRDFLRVTTTLGLKTILLHFALPTLFALFALADPDSCKCLRDLVKVSLSVAFGRVLLYPSPEERYYTWFLIIAAAAAAVMLGLFTSTSGGWFTRADLLAKDQTNSLQTLDGDS